ncbi:MAG: YciI family protein [Alphaproteobacteria bacterium]
MQFLVIAKDGTDEGALDRRMQVREAHLAGVKKLYEEGKFLKGGAILDDAGKMIGSGVIVDFPSREALDAWLREDPYVTGGVWEEITVHPFKVAQIG